MDLRTIKQKFTKGKYHSVSELQADLDLVWINAKLFNLDESAIFQWANELSAICERRMEKIFGPGKTHPPPRPEPTTVAPITSSSSFSSSSSSFSSPVLKAIDKSNVLGDIDVIGETDPVDLPLVKPPTPEEKTLLQECALYQRNGEVDKILDLRDKLIEEEEDGKEQEKEEAIESKVPLRAKREFLIKWKDRAYIHACWVPERVVERLAKQKLRSFLERRAEGFAFGLDNPVLPEFSEVDRILAVRQTRDAKLYYVKWCSLPYSESTWENTDVLSEEKIIEFERINGFARLGTDPISTHNAEDKKAEEELFKKDIGSPDAQIDVDEEVEIDDVPLASETDKDSYKMDLEKGISNSSSVVMSEDVPMVDAKPEIDVTPSSSKSTPSDSSTPISTSTTITTPTPPVRWQKYEESPDYKGGNALRPYQLEGLNWLLFCWSQRRSCILADEMGLGKTVQSAVFMHHLNEMESSRRPFLVVTPLSTIPNWTRELQRWTELNTVIYHGSKEDRELIRFYEFTYQHSGIPHDRKTAKNVKFNVLLTTYEMLLTSDWSILSKIKWRTVIVDEAQRLKSNKSKLLTNLRSFQVEFRLLLTGTPIQNNTKELWALLNYIEPKKFASLDVFTEQFGELKNSEQVGELITLLRPYLLRRMKEDVEKSIPPKEETIVEVEPTSLQKQYYRAMFEKNRAFLAKGVPGRNLPSLMNIMMQLRKVCNHPYLLEGVEEKERLKSTTIDEYYRDLIQNCGKLILLDKLLPKLKEGGHRVLIFSQMVRVLDILESFLKYRHYACERLDGGITGHRRQAAIDRFTKEDSESFVFLLSTRAGGFGINLASADTVIIYDSDWNPQNDLQAQARCHRIGQKKDVKVYRLITKSTYEVEMFERASKKLGLDQAVLGGIESTPWSPEGGAQQTSTAAAKDIDLLLRYGAYAMFRDEEDQNSTQFREEEIDNILQRAKVVRYDSGAKTGPSTFSKASFQHLTSGERAVDINAENFWDLVLPESTSVATLMDRLSKGDALSSDQKKDEFWQHITTFTKESLLAWDRGLIPNWQVTADELSKLLVACLESGSFSEVQNDQLNSWIQALQQTSKRKRKAIIENLGQTLKAEASRSLADPTFGEPAPKKIKESKAEREKKWNRFERRRFLGAFLGFGAGRSEKIKEIGQLDHKSLEDIRIFTNAIVQAVIAHLATSDPSTAEFLEQTQMIRKEGDPLTYEDPSLSDPIYAEMIKRKSKTWVNRLHVIHKLRQAIKALKSEDDLVIPNLRELDRNTPATWWTREADRDLLLGCYRHGYGFYSDIAQDEDYCFVKALQQAKEEGLNSMDIQIDGDKSDSDEDDQDKQKSIAGMPSVRMLDGRIRLVLSCLAKAGKETEGKKEEDKKRQEEEERKRLEKIRKFEARDWSRLEIRELKRMIMMFGDKWTPEQAIYMKVNRPNEQINDHVQRMISICRKIDSTGQTESMPSKSGEHEGGESQKEKEKGKEKKEMEKEKEIGSEEKEKEEMAVPMDTGDVQSQTTESQSESQQSSSSSTAPASSSAAAVAAAEKIDPLLASVNSVITAKRIVTRIDLLNVIRRDIIPIPEADLKVRTIISLFFGKQTLMPCLPLPSLSYKRPTKMECLLGGCQLYMIMLFFTW
jgi:chromodomain-helicase-DNA-binding protein 7